MRFFTLLLLTNIIVITLSAQSYEPLRSKGQLPKDFTVSPTAKYEQLVDGISMSARRSGRAIEEQFYLKSSFIIDELLKSGKVLFNDPVTKYVNEVADSLLSGDKELRQQLRFYTVRSASPNAFATHEGIIFVNLGLIARLENEAQLALVLAHEIVHYKEQHALNLFTNSNHSHAHLEAEKGFQREQLLEKQLLSKQQFSQDLEMEADREGLELFLGSNYSTTELLSLFDVLANSSRPFENESFRTDFFETDYLKFPSRFFLTKVKYKDANANQGLNPSYSSHPDVQKRKNAIQSLLKNSNSSYHETYLVGKPLFVKLREKARYELSYLYLYEGQYYNAIYNSYLLLESGVKSKHLEKCIAKALQGFVYWKNSKRSNKVEIHHNYVEGEIQQLHFFINKLKKDELNVIALTYAWELYKKYPNDDEISKVVNGLFQQMINFHYDKLDAFYKTSPLFNNTLVSSQTSSPIKDVEWEKDFVKYAFVGYMKDPEFITFFRSCKKEKYRFIQQTAFEESQRGQNIKKYQSKKILEEGRSLGIDRVVLVNPHYLKFDKRKIKDDQKLFIESEDARLDFRQKLWKNARLANLQTTILDIKSLSTTDVRKYNDIVALNEWFDQQLDFDYFDMASFNQEQVNSIAKKYNTDYFVWMGVVNKKERKNIVNSLSELYLPYTGLYNLLTPSYESLFFAVVYDVKNYELKMVKMEFIKQRDHNSIINAHIYDTFLQIKKEP